jgi:hemolysin E
VKEKKPSAPLAWRHPRRFRAAGPLHRGNKIILERGIFMDPKTTAENIKKGIKAAHDTLDLYNKEIDKMIPWDTFKEAVQELTRYQDHYSVQAAGLVSKIKTLLLNSQGAYHEATQSVYEWCGVTCKLLDAYLKLFDEYNERKAEAQKGILLKTLTDGITKMTTAQDMLAKSSDSFNKASGELIALKAQLNSDFDDKSDYFEAQKKKIRSEAYGGAAAGIILGPFGLAISYSIAAGVVEGELIPALAKQFEAVKGYFANLGNTVKNANTAIDEAKAKLEDEIVTIGKIKVATENTAFFVEFDDVLLDSLKDAAKELIKLCFEYQKRHGKKAIIPNVA